MYHGIRITNLKNKIADIAMVTKREITLVNFKFWRQTLVNKPFNVLHICLKKKT